MANSVTLQIECPPEEVAERRQLLEAVANCGLTLLEMRKFAKAATNPKVRAKALKWI